MGTGESARGSPVKPPPSSDDDAAAAADHRPSFLRRHAYASFSSLVLIAMIGHTLNQKWASPDFWVNLASIREFAASLFHPGNPLIVGSARDPYMSPYAFVLGAIVRSTGFHAVNVLAVAGIVNLLLLLFAIRWFVASVSTVEFAAFFTVLFTLFAWGFNPWRWSGFFSLNSLGTVLPLSSTFASAVGLISIAALCRWLRVGNRWQLVLVAVGTPLVLLSHPITAMWVGAIGIAVVLGETHATNLRRLLLLLVVIVASSLLTFAWPFYSISQTLTRSSNFDASNAAMYRGVVPHAFLALPGFVLLGIRLVRRHRDPLALGAVFNAAVYGAGYALHHDAFGRVLPGIMLMAHLAMAIWCAELVARWTNLPVSRRYAFGVSLAVVVVVGGAGSAGGAIRAVPRGLLPARYQRDERLASLVAPFDPVTRLIARDNVVVASPHLALGVAASSGKVIAPPAPAPFVDDTAARSKVVAALLSPGTSESEFRAVAQRYHVRWFVLSPGDAQSLRNRVQAGDLRPETSTPQLSVFRVVPARPA